MAAVASDKPLSAEAAFDSIGPAYEQAWSNNEPQLASIKWVISQLHDRKPAKCLDIGCASGRPTCSELADAGHDALGIDVSGVMVEAAKKNVPNAKFQKVDIDDFRADAGSFDAITVYFSLLTGATQDQIRGTIRKIYDWLKAGGVFVFATVPIPSNRMQMKFLGRQIVVSSLSVEDALSCISAAGFEIAYHHVKTFSPKAAEAGICEPGEVEDEPQLFVYAKKS